MTYARNSDNKYGFISLSLRHLHLLFKQRMLLEKKSGFCSQHDKRFMQLKQRDILGNYAEKNGGTARIALLINSPLFAKLRGVLRKCGTGSHAPDRSIKIPRRQSPLCANNGRSIFAPNTSIQKLTFFCFFCFSMKALDFLFFESYIINKKILFIEGGLPWL